MTEHVSIVQFGDSLTEWGPWSQLLPELNLVNCGVAGETTADMLQRVEHTLELQPHLVLVMAGINDLAQGETVDQVFSRYRTMLQRWRAAEIAVVVQSTLFVGSRIQELNPLVEQLNQRLQALCIQMGCRYVDLTSVLCPGSFLPPHLSDDELHLNEQAYQCWAKQIRKLVQSVEKQGQAQTGLLA